MNYDRIFRSIMALSVATWAGEARAERPSISPGAIAQPVFLLSERELGAGIKVCFLSNGLQVRLPSEKVCPYPLKAPPLATEPQPAPASTSPSILETSKPVAPVSPMLVEQPKPASLTSPSPPAAAASVVVKLPEPPPPKPSSQKTISQPVVQPVAIPRTANVSNRTQANAEANRIEPREVIEDEISDKAIRRCERIGFKLGTEPFKSCALDQINILSGLKP